RELRRDEEPVEHHKPQRRQHLPDDTHDEFCTRIPNRVTAGWQPRCTKLIASFKSSGEGELNGRLLVEARPRRAGGGAVHSDTTQTDGRGGPDRGRCADLR